MKSMDFSDLPQQMKNFRKFQSIAVQAILSAAIGQGAVVKYAVGGGQGAVAKAVYVCYSFILFQIFAFCLYNARIWRM